MSRPRLATQQAAADTYKVTDRTIRSWVRQGLIKGYRLPTGRAIRVDLDEIAQMIKTVPTVRAGKPLYGPHARIVDMSNVVGVTEQTGSNQ